MDEDYYLRRVDNAFWLSTAPFKPIASCHSIKELRNALAKAPESVISHHITKDKNDFANWIEEVIEYKELAKRIRGLKAKNNKDLKNKIVKELSEAIKY